MNLLPGCRLAVAPKFHLEGDWAARVTIGTGVEELGGKFFPRGPWRAPTAPELALLVARNEPTGALPVIGQEPPLPPAAPQDGVWLFQLPEHLRSVWWAMLDTAAESDGPLRGFDDFAKQVGEFLAFKQLDIPATAHMEALVTAAGERSIWRDPNSGLPSGLCPTIAPWAEWPQPDVSLPRLRAVVNLGDEPTGIVFVSLPFAGLAAEVTNRAPDDSAPATIGEVVERFFRACADYPPMRVRLGAGEGVRVPASGLVLDGDPTGKSDPDMLLLISN